jgi:hypothetical protein
MDKSQIIILSAVLAILSFRIYQKYIKKDKDKTGSNKNPSAGSGFSLSSKDDDYEPYSKK